MQGIHFSRMFGCWSFELGGPRFCGDDRNIRSSPHPTKIGGLVIMGSDVIYVAGSRVFARGVGAFMVSCPAYAGHPLFPNVRG